jgi:hypothetical protein
MKLCFPRFVTVTKIDVLPALKGAGSPRAYWPSRSAHVGIAVGRLVWEVRAGGSVASQPCGLWPSRHRRHQKTNDNGYIGVGSAAAKPV